MEWNDREGIEERGYIILKIVLEIFFKELRKEGRFLFVMDEKGIVFLFYVDESKLRKNVCLFVVCFFLIFWFFM